MLTSKYSSNKGLPVNHIEKIESLKKSLDTLVYISGVENSFQEIRNALPDSNHALTLKRLIQEKKSRANIEPTSAYLQKTFNNHSLTSISKILKYEFTPAQSECIQQETEAFKEVKLVKNELKAKTSKIEEIEAELENEKLNIRHYTNSINTLHIELEEERKNYAKEKRTKLLRLAAYIPCLVIGLIVTVAAIEFLIA